MKSSNGSWPALVQSRSSPIAETISGQNLVGALMEKRLILAPYKGLWSPSDLRHAVLVDGWVKYGYK